MKAKILLLLFILPLSLQAGKKFVIDKNTYIVAEKGIPAVELAAAELQYFIQKVTGIAPSIINEPAHKGKHHYIYLGEKWISSDVLKGHKLGEQEYLIDIKKNQILLAGKDTEEAPDYIKNEGRDNNGLSPIKDRLRIQYKKAVGGDAEQEALTLPSVYDAQGTCYAVYDFIERFLGVRFYGPHPKNVHIPSIRKVQIESQTIRRAPALKYRYGTYSFNWPMMKEQFLGADNDMLQLFVRRMRMGGRRWAANHAFTGYQDRFLKKNPQRPELFEAYHPEYFAQGRGGGASERQFCYTNPQFIKQVAKDAINYFKGKGTIGEQVALGDYFAIVPLDNASWCTCEACQKQLAIDQNNIIGSHFNCGTATHYMWNFINNVAKEVKKEIPDSNKKIAALAYHVYAYLPEDIQLEDNIAVAPCLHPRNYWAPGMEHNEMKFYKAWIEESKKSGRDIFLWNYLCFPTERGLVTNFKVFPGFNIHKTGEQLRIYAKDGVKGIFLCGIGEQIDFYITMKLMDNPEQDTDKLLEEFFTYYFGEVAIPMKAFYKKIESVYSSPQNYPENIRTQEAQFHQTRDLAWKYLGTKKIMTELSNYIQQADECAKTDLEKCRVDSWIQGIWNYMVEGYEDYYKVKLQ